MNSEGAECVAQPPCTNDACLDGATADAAAVDEVERARQSLMKKEAVKARRREDKVIGKRPIF